MSDRPKHKTLVISKVDVDNGVITFDRECPPGVIYGIGEDETWTFGPSLSVRSIPTLWQRVRGAWRGMIDGWRYGS